MNYLSDTSPEEWLLDLTELWHTSDSDVPLIEFLHLSKEEYAEYIRGNLSAAAIMDLYYARSR